LFGLEQVALGRVFIAVTPRLLNLCSNQIPPFQPLENITANHR
jgi:hypothetical protein